MGKRKMYKNAPIICDGRDGMSFVLYIIGWISRAAVHFACTFGSSLFIADAFGILHYLVIVLLTHDLHGC